MAIRFTADPPIKESLMFTSLWSRPATAKCPAARTRAPGRRRRPRPHLEPLEDRCLLSTYAPGPLALLSSPDPLPDAPPGFGGVGVAAEPYVAVNPINPDNIVAVWM